MKNLFSYIKENTSHSHKILETSYPFNTQMRSESFRVEHYESTLKTLLAFHQFCEPRVSALPSDLFPFMDTASPVKMINRDLQVLPGSSDAHPFITDVSDNNEEVKLACAYVWMGSSMGGSIIVKWLNRHQPDMPTHYYQHMAEQGQHWPGFLAAGTRFAEHHQLDANNIVDVANAMFSGLMRTGASYLTKP